MNAAIALNVACDFMFSEFYDLLVDCILGIILGDKYYTFGVKDDDFAKFTALASSSERIKL